MDGATEDIYFQKIKEFVQDEDRIVTCQTLSESLQITLEDAKILLGKYVDDQKEVQTNTVAATYLLAGAIKSGNYSIRLLDENRFNSESLSQEQSIHKIIYSAQKCLNIDSTKIAATQKLEIEKLRTKPLKGSIVGKNCVQRIISKKILPSPPAQKIVDKQKASFFCKTNFKTEQVKTQETCNKGDNKKKEPKTNGIASFFKGSTKVIPTAPIISNSKPIEKVESTDGKDVKKQAENKINVNGGGVNSEKDIKIIEKENKKVNGEDSTDSKRLLNDGIKEKKIEIVKKASHESTSSKPKKRSRSTSNKRKMETETKKRKRIKVISDSESDDMFGSDNDDTINVTESDEEIKAVPVQPAILAPKNKKRRAVDKTYQDEEGYIVTKTEYIYESASEDEVEATVQPKVEVKPKSPVGNVSPTRGNGKTKKNKKGVASANQPTLMNFFKKK